MHADKKAPTVALPEGGFGYLPEPGSPFSSGAIALDGYVLRRVRLRRPLTIGEGLAFAASLMRERDRPLTALAGCELRIPARLSRGDFRAFNAGYLAALRGHGFTAGDVNPIARSNMAPRVNPPASGVLAAFTFAVPRVRTTQTGLDFLISGKPENEGSSSRMIAPGDVSAAGVRLKVEFVIGELRRRVRELGGRWADITGAQIYTMHSLDAVMDILAGYGLAGVGMSLIPGEPPVTGHGDVPYEFEMDVRAITLEEDF